MTAISRVSRALIPVALALVFLSGCYMPVRYDAEIEVTREGYYSMIFDGYIAKVPLYDDLRQNKLTPSEEKQQVELVRTDLQNDTSMSHVSYVKDGIYSVHWEKEGDILRSKFVTFIRRNENMLSIRYIKKDGTVILSGSGAGQKQRQNLVDIGLDSSGEVRLITDTKVVAHNATEVKEWPSRGPRFSMYIWRLGNIFAPSPNLVIKLH